MDLAALQPQIQEFRQALEQEMREIVDRFLPGSLELSRMLQYHLGWMNQDGTPAHEYAGKQIRPVLLLLSAQAAGGKWHDALPAAAAIELIHNFSLIHDDIEDNSPLRRGRPTLWQVWDMPRAINAGDTMFSLAHMALWRLSETGVPNDRVIEVLRVFEETNLLLTRGQHLDMSFEHLERVSVDEYLEMIGGKSAALIAGAMEIGAIIGGLDRNDARQFAEYGFNLGLAFQIQDDILGIWGDPKQTGKSAATDILARKKSLPVLLGLAESPEFVDIYQEPVLSEVDVKHAVAILDRIGANSRTLEHVQAYQSRLEELRSLLVVVDDSAKYVLFGLSDALFGRDS